MQTMIKVTKRNTRIVEETVELLKKYRVIGVADLYKIRSGLLQALRGQMRRGFVIKCVKNTLLKRAMEEGELPGAEELFNEISGSNIFLFSDMNPFKLSLLLERNKVRVIAKPGDIAPGEIIIPSGNTGLAPGPILSRFGKVGVRTRIESGTIWVVEDTVVAEEGEELSEDLATILARLNIRATEMGLSLKAAYDDGMIIPQEDLMVDLEAVREQLKTSAAGSLRVAVRAAYPTTETIGYLVSMARENAVKVAVESNYLTRETASLLIAKAHAMAAALEERVRGSETN